MDELSLYTLSQRIPSENVDSLLGLSGNLTFNNNGLLTNGTNNEQINTLKLNHLVFNTTNNQLTLGLSQRTIDNTIYDSLNFVNYNHIGTPLYMAFEPNGNSIILGCVMDNNNYIKWTAEDMIIRGHSFLVLDFSQNGIYTQQEFATGYAAINDGTDWIQVEWQGDFEEVEGSILVKLFDNVLYIKVEIDDGLYLDSNFETIALIPERFNNTIAQTGVNSRFNNNTFLISDGDNIIMFKIISVANNRYAIQAKKLYGESGIGVLYGSFCFIGAHNYVIN